MGSARLADIHQLPDVVISHVLELVPQRQRHASVALVCKRLSRLVCSPQLLRELSVSISGDWQQALQRAQSLREWLIKHGSHVCNLQLAILPAHGAPSGERQALQLAIVAALATAHSGTAPQLEALTVTGGIPGIPLSSRDWLPSMRNLASVSLKVDSRLDLPAGLELLTALRRLEVAALRVGFAEGAQLPPALTHLSIEDRSNVSPIMPDQILRATKLQSLHLRPVPYSTDSLEGLSQLHGLTYLAIGPAMMPASLSALTGLKYLEADTGDEFEEEPTDESLQHLKQLTALVLTSDDSRMPNEFATLGRLERVQLWQTAEPDEPQLVHGPWLDSLRWLGTRYEVAILGLDVLAAAQKLEYLCLLNLPRHHEPLAWQQYDEEEWQQLWQWAATHPPLRRLSIDVDDSFGPIKQHLLDGLLWLKDQRPELSVFRSPSRAHPLCFLEELRS